MPCLSCATLRCAATADVRVGAHVSYPDLAGFGRREMQIASPDLRADVTYQVGALSALAKVAGTRVQYVKPHGALYNTIAHDHRQAQDVIEALLALDASLKLVVLAGSPLVDWARDAGFSVTQEAFADRGYMSDGSLVPRSREGAVLRDPGHIAERMLRWVREGVIDTIDGDTVVVEADSICVHGDSPGAVSIAKHLREALLEAGVRIAPFCEP
ncbi:LamB/YcsF family protein [Variovorax sp. SRS16]|uniref:LamB/YcsF family protein n=1 Tax=Variovorax sp. SRS16 TaxID=282217 RepID=UPI001318D9B9|nr:5-oxoprolinase subunit PxpA [Variovorax sp. SRS16]VTU30867.1 LamB/YcsF family protein [Variovorax sp. SRS16]